MNLGSFSDKLDTSTVEKEGSLGDTENALIGALIQNSNKGKKIKGLYHFSPQK